MSTSKARERRDVKNLMHLTSSGFFGGPERQMLGLAEHLENWRTMFVSFAEEGKCQSFLLRAAASGFYTHQLKHDFPRLLAATKELRSLLQAQKVDALFCHGYKANLVGRIATARLSVPAICVSRGWTAESFRVRCYEKLDRQVMRWLDHVVCVSDGQAQKVRAGGVPAKHISVIRNSVTTDRFESPCPGRRQDLLRMFRRPPRLVIAAAGRLSPEKGFDVLIQAAARVWAHTDEVGFVLFGDGPLRAELERQIHQAGLQEHFLLAGFRADLDKYFPHFDLLALSSHTEGLPNVILEAFAAGVPVVATAVGGVPEIVEEGRSGYLVPAGDAAALASRMIAAISNDELRREMGAHGKAKIIRDFSFASQAAAYDALLRRLLGKRNREGTSLTTVPRDLVA